MRDLPSIGSRSNWLQWPGLNQAEAKGKELLPGLLLVQVLGPPSGAFQAH